MTSKVEASGVLGFTEKDESYNSALPRKEYIEKVKANGFDVVESNRHTLLLDLDTKADYEYFQKSLTLVQEFVPGLKMIDEWPSKSGSGRHVVLKLDSPIMHTTARLLLEVILGSDRKRAALCYFRDFLKGGDLFPSLLFRPKVKSETPQNS